MVPPSASHIYDPTLKVLRLLHKSPGAAFPPNGLSHPWLGWAKLAVAIGVAYFLAARLGLFQRTQVGASIFWPATGVAVGALIALGPTAQLPVAIGVAVATAAACMIFARSVWLTIIFVFLNSGEALLTPWLIERWFGREFKLENVSQVLGFLVASAITAAIGAVGTAAAVGLVDPTTHFLNVWRIWFAASLLGAITVAPLLIGLGDAVRELPPRRELIEGGVGLVTLAGLSVFVISLSKGSWATAVPVALVFPLLLWVAVRCRPVFAAAAAFIVGFAIIWSTTFDVGHFGDANVPLADRIVAAQTFVLVGALLTLVLAALFSERRQNESALKKSNERLKDSNERLRLALDGAELGAFSLDIATGHLDCDARTAQIHGHNAPPTTIKEGRRYVHPDDRACLDTAFAAAERTGGVWKAEYRIVPPPNHSRAGESLWVAFEGSVLYSAQGTPLRMLGITRDITQHKRAEQALADRNRQLELAGKAALVGSFAMDIDVAREDFGLQCMQFSPGFAAIYGLPEETVEISVGDWCSLVHPDDLPQFVKHRQQLFAERRGEHHTEFRIVHPCGTMRWIEARSFIEYDGAGHARRLVGVNIDITERKRAEEARKILNAELDHRVKNALATVTAVISHTGQGSRSVADFAAALEGRIRSMAATHELLSSRHWQELSLVELIRRELAPYAASKNTEISGPTVLLKPEAGQAMAMVLHELATNAAKYGALSTNKGRVLIRWDRWLNGHPPSNLVLDWREVGGPRVNVPRKSSYGTSTIHDLIPYEFGGTVSLIFAPEGVRCRLELPPDWLINMGEATQAVVDTAR
jgi:PAS domain S-box-containing protein